MSESELMTPVRALYAAFNRRDWDAFFADADPEVEWVWRGEEHADKGQARAAFQWPDEALPAVVQSVTRALPATAREVSPSRGSSPGGLRPCVA
jgi:ketosteroid isomerase-like protein